MYITDKMYWVARFAYFLLLCKLVVSTSDYNPLSDSLIDFINKQGKWTAGRNFHPDTPLSYIKKLLGVYLQDSKDKDIVVVKHSQELIDTLPESFDPRQKWPNCPSLNEIRDQGRCGSCWAFAAVEAMTDRICIYSNGTKNFHFSAEDLMTCNEMCNGCHGGDLRQAYRMWIDEGLASGGNYKSQQGCKPYSIPTCKNHATMCRDYVPTPACVRSCVDGYNVTYENDRKRGKNVYKLLGEDNIKAELFQNGSVSAVYVVYEDFTLYKSGIYQHITGPMLGLHAVKILGWGVENRTKYWLVANSWNTDFGENGYFKIRRGVDECGIEGIKVLAGEPLI